MADAYLIKQGAAGSGSDECTEEFFQGRKDHVEGTQRIYGGRICLRGTGDDVSDQIPGGENYIK